MIKITTNLPEGVLASTDSFYIEEQKGYYKYCIYSHNGWVVDTARNFGEAKKMMETLQFAEDIRDGNGLRPVRTGRRVVLQPQRRPVRVSPEHV